MTQRLRSVLYLLFLFIVSRLSCYVIGVRFDTTALTWYLHYLDPIDLKNNLFQSLFYLHSQPPGFNFFIGLILKLAPKFELAAFQVIYVLFGLIMTLILFKLLTEFKISPTIALLFSIFFAISPPVILYENWLFYTYPIMLLLLLSALFLYEFINNHHWIYIFLFFLNLALLVITRTMFQPIWFIMILIGVIIFNKNNAKKILLASLVPLLLISSLYCKNYIVFKEAKLSSWLGMNLIKMTFTIPLGKIVPLIDNGDISDIALKTPFEEPEVYKKYANFDTVTGIPVLDKKYRSTGSANFNHIGYISVSREYHSAAKSLIKKFPLYYGLSIIKAFYFYLRPSSSFQESNNTKKLAFWTNLYEKYLLGDIMEHIWNTTYTTRFNKTRKIHINFLYIFIPIIYCWGIILSIKGKNILNFTKEQAFLVKYMMFNIIYITFLGNFIEVGENMRFRFLIVPFIYIFTALLFKYLIPRKT